MQTVETTTSSPNSTNAPVVRSAVGHSVDGDDMHWTVCCPDCSKEFEYKGWFDSSEETKCKCGCVFRTTKVWLDDDHYIQ